MERNWRLKKKGFRCNISTKFGRLFFKIVVWESKKRQSVFLRVVYFKIANNFKNLRSEIFKFDSIDVCLYELAFNPRTSKGGGVEWTPQRFFGP